MLLVSSCVAVQSYRLLSNVFALCCFLATCYFTWNRYSVIAYAVDSTIHFAIYEEQLAETQPANFYQNTPNRSVTYSKRWVAVLSDVFFSRKWVLRNMVPLFLLLIVRINRRLYERIWVNLDVWVCSFQSRTV